MISTQQGSVGDLRFWHQPPPGDGGPGQGGFEEASSIGSSLVAWAAVGPVDPAWGLPEPRRFGLERVPLAGLPPWLGIDRALAGWGAWRREQLSHPGAAVLVADAGTALSLTRVDGRGRFQGGRLMAGYGLQLRALAAGTAALPDVSSATVGTTPGATQPDALAVERWPEATAAAIATGVGRGLAAALWAAGQELAGAGEPATFWLTGGDAPMLLPLLEPAPWPLRHDPDLVLEALVLLSSGPGPRGSHRPGFPP